MILEKRASALFSRVLLLIFFLGLGVAFGTTQQYHKLTKCQPQCCPHQGGQLTNLLKTKWWGEEPLKYRLPNLLPPRFPPVTLRKSSKYPRLSSKMGALCTNLIISDQLIQHQIFGLATPTPYSGIPSVCLTSPSRRSASRLHLPCVATYSVTPPLNF